MSFQNFPWAVGRLGKKGGILDEESMKTIIAVAVFIGMIYLMVFLLSPVFNKGDKVAESYFETLKISISEAYSVGSANFFMLDNGNEDLNFYLVYFGSINVFSKDGKQFRYKDKAGENIVCICFEKKGSIVCRYCDNLELPAVFPGKENSVAWAIPEDMRIKITKSGGVYVFGIR